MTREEYFEGRLAELHAEWSDGRHSAVMDAFRECAIGGYQLPEWLALAVDDELCWSFENRPIGRGATGNRQAGERATARTRIRRQVYERCIQWQQDEIRRGVRQKINKAEARRETSEMLRKSVAVGSPEAIRDDLGGD